MWDDQNDKKIKEAAGQYHPAYDENAWKKMEQMLDEHLPQKKGRRWIILLLPFLLLLIGGWIYFAVYHNRAIPSSEILQKTASKSTLETQPVNSSSGKQQNNLQQDVVTTENFSAKNKEVFNTSTIAFTNKNSQKNSIGNLSSQRKSLLKQNIIPPASFENATVNNGNDANISGNILSPKDENVHNENIAIKENDKDQPKKVNTDIDITVKVKRKADTTAKAENTQNTAGKKKTTKTKNSFSKNFGISVSAGPGISGVRLSDAGKITVSYGAGLRYSFLQKFTIRTGFYVSKKIYSVEGYDYHLPPNSQGSGYLQNVNANCKVYEIPLSLSYSFGKAKKHNWFASAGLSSYLMKKEAYNYYYKYPTGQTYSRDWTIQNKNQHFLSVLDLSSGYEYALNKRFFIMAEPYVNIPLSGIGLGKIKLNSGGILFTFTVKPF